MEIIKLNGTEKKLYSLIGPLAMDAEVLKQNNGYPYKTSVGHTWYIAVEGKKVVGFLPFISKKNNTLYIDNYYIENDNEEVIHELLWAVINDFYSQKEVECLVHKRHVDTFKDNGFRSIKLWKNYETMHYEMGMEDGV